jgi:hypothetical protein
VGRCKFYCLRKKGCEDIAKCKGYIKSKGEELVFMRSDASLFLARLGVGVTLNRRWKLEDLVPAKKRFAISVVRKTLHKSLPIEDALSCLAPRGFDAMPNPHWMKTTGRIKSVLSPLAHPGFDVTPTTVVRNLRKIASRFGKVWVSADQSFDGSLWLKSREGKVHFWVVGRVRRSPS